MDINTAYSEKNREYMRSLFAGIDRNTSEALSRMMRDNVLKMVASDNLLVVRTLPGTAQGVASCIDNLAWQEIIGTVAGDDTILLVIKNKDCCKDLLLKLQDLAQ